MFKSSNPAITRLDAGALVKDKSQGIMTVKGSIDRSLLLGAMVLAASGLSWHLSMPVGDQVSSFAGTLPLWGILGFVTALVTIFKPSVSSISAPIYAVLEGLFLGTVSVMFEARFPGIVFQALMGTIGVFVSMLVLYRTKVIQVTEKFRSAMFMMTAGVGFIYLLSFIMSLFGIQMTLIHDTGMVGIGFSLVVVGIASASLLVDFDNIQTMSQRQLPKYMEWYAGFSLLITLVWLYLEMLRLLSKLRD